MYVSPDSSVSWSISHCHTVWSQAGFLLLWGGGYVGKGLCYHVGCHEVSRCCTPKWIWWGHCVQASKGIHPGFDPLEKIWLEVKNDHLSGQQKVLMSSQFWKNLKKKLCAFSRNHKCTVYIHWMLFQFQAWEGSGGNHYLWGDPGAGSLHAHYTGPLDGRPRHEGRLHAAHQRHRIHARRPWLPAAPAQWVHAHGAHRRTWGSYTGLAVHSQT